MFRAVTPLGGIEPNGGGEESALNTTELKAVLEQGLGMPVP